MGGIAPVWSRIQKKRSLGILSPILAFFSFLYGLGVRLRLAGYGVGFFKRQTLPGFVLSIGNLTVGGTGKTPAAAMLAKWARDEGRQVAVLSRGYGGDYKEKVLEVSDGRHIKADPHEAGDEPYLLAKELHGIPVLVSRERYPGGLFARKKYGSDFFILDDGFQHMELNRNLDLVLIDASNPFGNGRLLPRGPLREPLGQLARADAYILTNMSQSDTPDALQALLRRRFPGVPFFCADHIPEKLVFPHSGETHKPEKLKGKRVLAFAGIARPEGFTSTLTRLGADIVHFKAFGDHYKFKIGEIRELERLKEKIGAEYLLTTQKDWIRIERLGPVRAGMAYLCVNFSLISGQDNFFRMIQKAVNG